jgi:hypothetical protein
MKGVFRTLRALLGSFCSNKTTQQTGAPTENAAGFLTGEIGSASWLALLRSSPRLFPAASAEALARLKTELPGQAAAAISAGERILRHEFNMLGSGLYRPIDPERQAVGAYLPIDWNIDPISGLRFPSGIHYKSWDLWKMRPGMADVKLPWELARCQHWLTLAQAWLLTGDARFAEEMFAQRADFDAANPVGYGIHWTCTMDVAIRAANWALALEMVRDYPAPETVWLEAYRSLFAHGDFIRSNLEDKYEVTSNHFLSNVIGLYYLARVFQESPQAQEWEVFSRNAIEREMHVQILPDGADFESSVPYHRLVAELFLGAVRVADHSGSPFSSQLRTRLQGMVEYLLGVLRPDGLMPQLGDADDGRLHILTDYGTWQPQDARHLLASASCVLGIPELLRYSGTRGRWEAFWWSGGADSSSDQTETLPEVDKHFPNAGIVIHRSPEAYLAITNGIVGTKGFGNHKHNDLLSFEYHPGGIPLIVDPGSYVYTSDLDARNLFRGTGYHNTLMVDGIEQNETNPEWIFRLFEKATPETLEYRVTADTVVYHGRHVGYTRLEHPVVHERRFELNRKTGVLAIDDRLEGAGPHKLGWHFHLAPGVEATLGTGAIRLWRKETDAKWQLTVPANANVRCVPAWYSPSYGVRIPCQALELEAEVALPNDACWHFVITPIGAEQ